MFLAVCAVLSGAEGWEAMVGERSRTIEYYGHIKLNGLRKFVPLAKGIPRHDTIARVLSRLDPEGLQHTFIAWMQGVSEVTAGEVVAIDGKSLRRFFDKASRKSALHMVSAWANRNGVVLGQVKTDNKSNEITAVPALLKVLELKGCMVTLDAMGCQRAIASLICAKQADYVLSVKDNQGVLREDIVAFFETAQAHDFAHCAHEYHEDTEAGHGRVEVRRYWQSPRVESVSRRADWVGLKTIGMTEPEVGQSERHIGTRVSVERRYYISSLPLEVKTFARAVRQHWGPCTGYWM